MTEQEKIESAHSENPANKEVGGDQKSTPSDENNNQFEEVNNDLISKLAGEDSAKEEDKNKINQNPIQQVNNDFIDKFANNDGASKNENHNDNSKNDKEGNENKINANMIEDVNKDLIDKMKNGNAENNEIEKEINNIVEKIANEEDSKSVSHEPPEPLDNSIKQTALLLHESIANQNENQQNDESHEKHLENTTNDTQERNFDEDEDNEQEGKNIEEEDPNGRYVAVADAAVQIESDALFETAINSPRIHDEMEFDNDEQGYEHSQKGRKRDDVPALPPIEQFSPDELHAALQRMIKTKKLPPQEMRQSLLGYGRKQTLYKLMEEDYDSAAKIDEAVEQLAAAIKAEENSPEDQAQLQNYLEDAKTRKFQIEERHKQMVSTLKEDEERRRSQLEQQHESERQAFENHWASTGTVRQFTKPSSALFQIRKQQRAYAISHDFASAKALKKMGDSLQKEESERASKRAATVMKRQYAIMLAKQEKENRCFLELQKRKFTQLEVEKKHDIEVNDNFKNAVEYRLNNPKTVKKPKIQIPQTTARGVDLKGTALLTYRTRNQYSNFIRAPDKTRLDVRIGDIKKITKSMNPPPKKGKNPKDTLFE